jgi:uncharacterized protein (TIGR03000 family)
MFHRIFALNKLLALAVIGAFLAPEPVAAQQGQDLYEWAGHWGRYSTGASYGSSHGSTYYKASPVVDYRFFEGPRTELACGNPVTREVAYGSLPSRPVWVDVSAPAPAQIWFGQVKMDRKGKDLHFVSPPVTADGDYVYDITAKWTENGKEVTKHKHLTVRAGERKAVSFTADQGGGKR